MPAWVSLISPDLFRFSRLLFNISRLALRAFSSVCLPLKSLRIVLISFRDDVAVLRASLAFVSIPAFVVAISCKVSLFKILILEIVLFKVFIFSSIFLSMIFLLLAISLAISRL